MYLLRQVLGLVEADTALVQVLGLAAVEVDHCSKPFQILLMPMGDVMPLYIHVQHFKLCCRFCLFYDGSCGGVARFL